MVRRGSIVPIIIFGALFAVALVIGGNFLGLITISLGGGGGPLGDRVLIADSDSSGFTCLYSGSTGRVVSVTEINGINYLNVAFDEPAEGRYREVNSATYPEGNGCLLAVQE